MTKKLQNIKDEVKQLGEQLYSYDDEIGLIYPGGLTAYLEDKKAVEEYAKQLFRNRVEKIKN